MKKKVLFSMTCVILAMVSLIALFTTGVFGSAAPAALSDDLESFNSASWSKSDGWTNGNEFNNTWRASNVNFNDGQMQLSITNDPEVSKPPYAGGEYRTNNKYGYGVYEVKMKPAKNDGIVSSFFTYTGPSDNNAWDEIDIEFLGKDTTKGPSKNNLYSM